MPLTTESQLSLLDGLDRQRVGRDRVEWSHEYWIQEMRVVAMKICQERGFVTTDDIHRHVETHACFPEKNTAFTGIFRGQGWRDIGYVKSSLKTNHARLIRKWVWRG